MLSAVILSRHSYPAFTIGMITGTPAVCPSRFSRIQKGSPHYSNAYTLLCNKSLWLDTLRNLYHNDCVNCQYLLLKFTYHDLKKLCVFDWAFLGDSYIANFLVSIVVATNDDFILLGEVFLTIKCYIFIWRNFLF